MKCLEVIHQNKEKDKNWREVKPYRLANSMWRNRDELLIVETDKLLVVFYFDLLLAFG